MANPYGDDVFAAAEAARRLNERLAQSEERIKEIERTAQRAGQSLRIPAPREPVIATAMAHQHLADEFKRRQEFVRGALQILKTESGKFFVRDPRGTETAYVPEGRQRGSYFGGAGRAQSEATKIAAEIARKGEFVTDEMLRHSRERISRLEALPKRGMDQQAILNSERRRLEVLEDLQAREREAVRLHTQTEQAKTEATQEGVERRRQIRGVEQYDQPIGPDRRRFEREHAARLQAEREQTAVLAAEERKRYTQTEGNLKRQSTRLRKLQESIGYQYSMSEEQRKAARDPILASIDKAAAASDRQKTILDERFAAAERAARAEREFGRRIRDRRAAEREAAPVRPAAPQPLSGYAPVRPGEFERLERQRRLEALRGLPSQADQARLLRQRLRETPRPLQETAGGGGRAVLAYIDRVLGDPARAIGEQFRGVAEGSRILAERIEASRTAVERHAAGVRRATFETPYAPIPAGAAPPQQPPRTPPPTAPPPPPPRPPAPPPPPLPPGYDPRGQAEAMRRANLEAARSVTALGAVSQSMRRHGAATTEFLTALAQGRTTVAELGWQVGNTAGKFAAWTAASIGVFGALSAVAEVGRGAIDSMSGVNELSRFITDLDTSKAQGQFRALSQEFNLPIEDVTIAFAQMGRVFNQQDDAFRGAQAALLAARVGELEVADSTRFLSAIIQGFRLTAQDLPTVIDQINNAQNRLNFSIRDGAAGIARAAGSWHAAGGTFSELLAIMTTAQRSTGASGEVVGTAFRRSAEFIGREANRARLQAFGIDPDRGVDQVYRQAFAAVESGRVRGQDVTRLATALASPQLAAVIAPTLQNFELFQKALRDTNAEAARGSARRELATQLDAISERIRRVGTELQQLGSNLAQSGFLAGLQLALETTLALLTATNNLLGMFNEMPTVLRQSLAIIAQMYLATRLLRRLNVGTALAEAGAATPGTTRGAGFGALGRAIQGDPNRVALRQVLADLDEDITYLRNERETLARQTAVAGREARTARRNVERGVAAGVDAEGYARLEGVALAEERKHAALKQQTADATDDIVERERQRNEVQKAGRRDAERGLAAARREGALAATPVPIAGYVPTAERPTERGVVPLPGTAAPSAVRAARAVPAVEPPLVAAERSARAISDSSGRLSRAGNAAASGLGRAGGAMATVGRGVAGLAVSIGAMLGPIGFLFIGLSFLPAGINAIQESIRRSREAAARLRDETTSVFEPETRRRRLRQARRVVEEIPFETDETREAQAILDAEAERQRQRRQGVQAQRVARARGSEIPAIPYQDIEEIRDALAPALQNLSRSHNAAGEAAALYRRYVASFEQSRLAELSRASDAEIIGGASREDVVARARRLGAQIPSDSTATVATQAIREVARQRVDEAIRRLRESISGFLSTEDIAALDINRPYAEIAAELTSEAQAIQAFGATRGRLDRVAVLFTQATAHLGDRRDQSAVEAAVENRQRLEDALQQASQGIIENARRALTPRGRARRFDRGIRSLGRSQIAQARDIQQDLRGQVEAAREAVAQARTNARGVAAGVQQFNRGLRAFGGIGDPILGLATGDAGAATRGQLRQAETHLRTVIAQERAAGRSVRILVESLRALRADLARAELADAAALIDAQVNLDVARAGGDQQAAARARSRGAGRKKRDIEARLRRDPDLRDALRPDLLNAEAETINAKQDEIQAAGNAVDEALQRIAARGRLNAARAGKGGRGGAILGSLYEQLSYAQAHGADQNTIMGLQADIAEQQSQNAEDAKQLAEEARQKQREAIESLFELRRSRTDDPVALARLDEAEALRLRTVGGDLNERRRAQARVNETRRRRAESRRDREIEDAELYRDIGRIGDDQLARVLERAIKDRSLGVEYRRKLRHRLLRLRHEMNQESALDLNVGNIRLPSVYEIRRFVTAQQQGLNVTNSYSTTVTVNGDTDLGKLGAVLDRQARGTSKAIARARARR